MVGVRTLASPSVEIVSYLDLSVTGRAFDGSPGDGTEKSMDGEMSYLLILGLVVLVPGGRAHTRLCTTLYR